jgi:glycosyltransferase involved in cell wall biosynthesis
MPRWYRSADVLAAAPWYEPFGLTPLEAMACGVPVVGAAVGGLLDSVVDGVTGLLVPPRDPAATAAALGRVLGDERLRLRLGRAAAEDVATRFGWPRVAELTETVYAQLAADAPAAIAGPEVDAVERALA